MPDLAGVRLAEGYEVLELQSSGRVAAVYEARSLHDGERVVVKVLLPEHARSRRHVEWFLASARTGAGLRHPNIAAVLACGRVPAGSVYFARERLEGVRLRRFLAERGGIAWAQAKPLLAQLLDALDHAHAQQITHGGVEPARCWLVGGEGDPARSQLVVTGFGLFGSPRDPWPLPEPYRAPELDRGGEASPGSDVYGVGALAYELLSGMPWSPSTSEPGRSTGVCELVPDVPHAVDRVLARALHPDPSQRFAGAAPLRAAFRKAAGLPLAEPAPKAPVAPAPRTAPVVDPAPSPRAPPRAAFVPPPRAAFAPLPPTSGSVGPPPAVPSSAAASFRYPPSPASAVPSAAAPARHPRFDEQDEEITAVHTGDELDSIPLLAPRSPILDRAGAPVPVGFEGTVRLDGARLDGAPLRPAPHEETVLLATEEGERPFGDDDDEPTANKVAPPRRLEQRSPATARASRSRGPAAREETSLLDGNALPQGDRGWGTVVLPGGGHPDHFGEETQLLAVELPDEPSAAISMTSMISVSLGAPEAVDEVSTASLTGMGGARLGAPRSITLPASPPSPIASPMSPSPGPWASARSTAVPSGPAVAIPMPVRGPVGAPGAWPIPRVGPVVPPTGGYPVVPLTGGYPVVSGPYPVVTPTGGSPIVQRSALGPRGRRAPPVATGAHPNLRTKGDDTTRLAWGFLVGVLITVGIVAGAGALALFLLR